MRRNMLGILCFLTVGLCGSIAGAEPQQGTSKKGEAIYMQHCAGCHGTSGDGLGPDIKELIVPPANCRAMKSRTKTDMELYLAIKQGVLFSPMHGWADRLTDQEIRDVVRYIRNMAPFNPVG